MVGGRGRIVKGGGGMDAGVRKGGKQEWRGGERKGGREEVWRKGSGRGEGREEGGKERRRREGPWDLLELR